MTKRFLASILTICLLLALCPAPARAISTSDFQAAIIIKEASGGTVKANASRVPIQSTVSSA